MVYRLVTRNPFEIQTYTDNKREHQDIFSDNLTTNKNCANYSDRIINKQIEIEKNAKHKRKLYCYQNKYLITIRK